MIADVLVGRVQDSRPQNALEQENVLAELLQQFILASLSRAGLFSRAVFHGGSCLRVLYGLNRFSEDLDFLTRSFDPGFEWAPYVAHLSQDLADEGFAVECRDRLSDRLVVKKAMVKVVIEGFSARRELPFPRQPRRTIHIKLEVDANPPGGSLPETRYITFPSIASTTSHTLPSGFALKSHALLCRPYTKGRDWYDFLWCVSKRVRPDLGLLQNALEQEGPWAGTQVDITWEWYLATMRERIMNVDWDAARADVSRFIVQKEIASLALWGPELSIAHLDTLARIRPGA
ncbi:nucleotidyl transferase AbiEii/AbiGii toxin family protein [Candidatus Fermentibacteria bacterium]|nr:nucleotidyl transferase AbiEii/AbiGii toxin family protein [Candidatus Fermentibacteria bacterium]